MRLGLGLGDDEKHGFTWDRDKEVLRLLRWIRVHQLHSCSRHDVWQNSVWKVPAAPEMPPQTKFGPQCAIFKFAKYHTKVYKMLWAYGPLVLLLVLLLSYVFLLVFFKVFMVQFWRPQVSLLLEPGSLPKPQHGNVTEKPVGRLILSTAWNPERCVSWSFMQKQ